jgi:hypothetical protein
MNIVVDRPSKARVGLDQGTWIIAIMQNKHTIEYNHEPWN